ncbi:GNAT family N-acetyltransferase [Stieleria sp. TO1_6]|uniref:GNAT family N-acetyltransferase n=1 Tax=Stieleria tagensis TaxID=2956795 RepID=UPI00209BA0E0|nr:GNAT family N-acetyltransferase [Stieleria tagensis]MCO8124379.1 GNAT family N-acetyltransferase [Stieleria tagensis]
MSENTSIRVRRCGDLTKLLADNQTWDGLAGAVPFRQSAWLEPWWEHFGSSLEPYVLVATDQNESIRGILPLFRCQSAGARGLSMIGSGDACSDYVSILCQPSDSQQVTGQMAKFLVNAYHQREDSWDYLDIDGIAESDPVMRGFAQQLSQSGASLHATSEMSAWRLPRDATWDDYLNRLAKTQRRKVRRWSEKVASLPGLERHLADTSTSVEAALEQLIAMHQRRWNAAGQDGSYARPRFREFIHDAAVRFFERGQLYLPTLKKNGRVISAELHFQTAQRQLYCYSSGYEVDCASIEPGRILLVQTLLDLHRSEWPGIDFLRGDEIYKRRFGCQSERILRVRAFAPGMTNRVRSMTWNAGFEAKQWMRSRLGRTPHLTLDMAANQTPSVPN